MKPMARIHPGGRMTITSAVWAAATAGIFAAAPPPAPLLEANTFTPKVGQAVELRLHLPNGDGWRQANIGKLVARSGARQWTLALPDPPEGDAVRVVFDQPGPAIILLSAGPANARGRSDSWQQTPYCSKAVLRVQPEADSPPAPPNQAVGGTTAKSGQKIEILPLVDPTSLRPGDWLPLRLYFEGAKVEAAQVQAFRSDAAGQREAAAPIKTSDAVGTTSLRIDRDGPWLIRFEHAVDGLTYTAELMFEVSQ